MDYGSCSCREYRRVETISGISAGRRDSPDRYAVIASSLRAERLQADRARVLPIARQFAEDVERPA